MCKKLSKWLFPKKGMRIKITVKEKFFLISRDINPVPIGKQLHLFIVKDKHGRADIFIEGDDMRNEYPGWGERISYRDTLLYADDRSADRLREFMIDRELNA